MQEHTNEELHAVTVYFNPYKWKSRKVRYEQFAKDMAHAGVKLLTVEIGYKKQPFEVTDMCNPWHLQIRSNVDMWHKERGLNLGFQRLLQLVPHAGKVAWIDADVRFSNPDWVKDTLTALDHFKVVQLYSEAQSLDPKHVRQWSTPSVFYNYRHNIGYHQEPQLPLTYTKGGHPGLAWAARIDTLHKLGGLIDFCIHGSGDTYMANALMGNVKHAIMRGAAREFVFALEQWAKRCDEHVKKNIGYVPGICYHYWHGKPQKRGYEKRWDVVCFHKFNPYTDIYSDLNGLYQYSSDKPHFAYDLTRSLTERNEDSIDA